MARCIMCNKQSMFLRVDSRGLCRTCAEMLDTAKEKRRRMLSEDFPSAKEFLSKALLKEAQSYYDLAEGSRMVNKALSKNAVLSQNTELDNDVYNVLLSFVVGDNNKRAEILRGIRSAAQLDDSEDYIDFLAGLIYELDKAKLKYERMSSGVNNL